MSTIISKPKNYPFVEPEIAKLAKEKGFQESCYAIYDERGVIGLHPMQHYNEHDTWNILAPLYQQLIDWFREEKKIDISYMPNWEYQGSGDLYLDGYEFTIQPLEEYEWHPSKDIQGEFYITLQEAIKKAFELI